MRRPSASMVVVSQPLAADAGLEAFRRGGNAFDAAVATAFAQGVVDPLMCGIGGFGSAVIYHAGSEKLENLQWYGAVGSRAHPRVFERDIVRQVAWGRFELRDDAHLRGYRSITVPGEVLGLQELYRRYGSGRVTWAELLEPAIALARDGFAVHPHVYSMWRMDTASGYRFGNSDVAALLQATDEAAALYLNHGRPFDTGERMVLSDLARTLAQIAEKGPSAFYEGDIAHAIARDLADHGGFVTYEDLKAYTVRTTAPVEITYRDLRVASSAPPGSGFQVLQTLRLVEPFDLRALGHNAPEYIRVVSRAMKLDFRDRAEHLADPAFTPVPLDRLLSPEYCHEWSERIEAGDVPGPVGDTEERGTTHLVAIDRDGNAVSMTHSLGSTSGVVTPGLGFVYNNHMEQYWPLPGHRNSIEPGKRRPAGTGATVVLRGDRPIYLVGSAGGSRVVTSVVQCILNVFDHGMSAVEAVTAPRFHCEGDVIYAEASIPAATCRGVEALGYRITRSVYSYETSFVFGVVQSLLVGPGGQLEAAPDCRGGGGAVVFGQTARPSAGGREGARRRGARSDRPTPTPGR